MESCVCNSGKTYTECCGPFIAGEAVPGTPEALMRSRYTAYAKANMDYIASTMKGPAALDFDKNSAKQWATQIEWKGLKIIRSEQKDIEGKVEFIAHCKFNGNEDVLYEISEFLLENGRWYYVDGVTPKIGRNDPCPCGSLKKYKKCCGK